VSPRKDGDALEKIRRKRWWSTAAVEGRTRNNLYCIQLFKLQWRCYIKSIWLVFEGYASIYSKHVCVDISLSHDCGTTNNARCRLITNGPI
jgi:hypothetical protein